VLGLLRTLVFGPVPPETVMRYLNAPVLSYLAMQRLNGLSFNSAT